MSSPRVRRRDLFRCAAAAGALLLDPAYVPGKGRWWSGLVWAMFENRPFTRVASLPSHRRLAREGTVLTQYFAVSHPSGPNYRAMASGETWGRSETIDTFHPSVASEAAAISPPVPTYIYHLGGRIPRKHDPFTDLHAPIASVGSGLGALQNDLRQDLPEACLVYIGWDDDNNMHNGNPARADRNLMALLNTLAVSRWFTTPDGSGRYPALFFCYDEDDGGGDNRVFAAWWGRGVRKGHVSAKHHTHYGFCRTLTENWGLRTLARAASETPIDDVWV